MTIFEALKISRKKLSDAGIESAALDASLILSHLTHLSKVQLITHDSDELSEDILNKLNSLIDKRITGYPIAYILGYKEFWGLKLKVTEDTLIPRPDTEVIVQCALDCKVKGPILDMGTGSGAIILALKSTMEGNATTLYITKKLAGKPVTISRLATGLPMGAEIDYLDVMTLSGAIEDRKKIS